MSIVNYLVESDRVLVAFDTLANHVEAGKYGTFGSKCLYLPQAATLIAGRGDARHLQVAQQLIGFSTASNFDEVEEVIDQMLVQANRDLQRLGQAYGPLSGGEFMFAGWSPSRSRMVSFFYSRPSGAAEWSEPSPLEACIGPALPGYCDGVGGMSTAEGMMAIARRQVAMTRPQPGVRGQDSVAIGGSLFLATLKAEEMHFRNLGKILVPLDAEEVRAMGIDPAHWASLVESPVPSG